MAGRKVFNEQDARRCLAAVAAWRGELGPWARAHGVDGRSLNLWRLNLKRRHLERPRAAAPRLVELVVAPTPPVAVTRAAFLVRIGAVEVQVPERFDEAAFRRLVAVLKSC